MFQSMSDRRIAALTYGATRRVVLATPGIRDEAAEALAAACERLGADRVTVVLDCSEEVFRLGYGELGALDALAEAGCGVRQAPGLRIGVLVCDERAWVFSPTALFVQPEVHSDETPNCAAIPAAAVLEFVDALCGVERVSETAATAGPELGLSEVSEEMRREVSEALDQAPPLEFDVTRQVRVFQPYLQYVDISLKGAAIQRHRVEVPSSIQGLDRSGEMASRLRTTFELIGRDSELSSTALESALKEIREIWTRSLGRPWGRVILRARRGEFDERIAKFREALEEHRLGVQDGLEKTLAKSKADLIGHFLPLALERPPDVLLGQLSGVPTEEQVRAWLEGELDAVFPRAGDLLKGMELEVQFRDVTFETLNEDGFVEALRREYPRVDWDRPYDQFHAARERGGE